MYPLITHHTCSAGYLKASSSSDYARDRSHPERPPRMAPMGYLPVHVPIDTTARRLPARDPHARVVHSGDHFKVIGYATETFDDAGEPEFQLPATTGTSRPGWTCVTAELDCCIGLAITGVARDGHGGCLPGGKVRLFHIFPSNRDVAERVQAYVQSLRTAGLTVAVAMNGGDSSAASRRMATQLRRLVQELDLEVCFDKINEPGRAGFDTLGVGIDPADHKPYFVTHLQHERSGTARSSAGGR